MNNSNFNDNMKNEDIIPKSQGSYAEEIILEGSSINFSFEPDPDYTEGVSVKRADTFCVEFKEGELFNAYLYFSSLDKIEEFANQLLAFVERHRNL